MPEGRVDDSNGAGSRELSFWHRLLLSLPHLDRGREKVPLGERFRRAVVKPAEPDTASTSEVSDKKASSKKPSDKPSEKKGSVEELEDAVRYADDKERIIGLLAAPVAAIISITVTSALISGDHPLLKNGHVNTRYVPISDYHQVLLVLLGMSVLTLAAAWFRKRLFMGMLLALYGLGIFNLHYWGFGVPFLMVGAWFLVRTFRAQRDLRDATSGTTRPGASRQRRGTTDAVRPQPNKRYTPPPPKRPLPPKSDNKRKAV